MQRSRLAPSPPSAARGLSFVEVLVVLLLLSMVVAAMLPLLASAEDSYQELRRRQAMVQNARVATDKMLRELRAAESLRVVQNGLLRFTLSYGDGTGARPTVEYVLDANGMLLTRWQANWDYRRRITVRAQDAVPLGYAVALTFNHAALVTAGKSLANGDDVRVWFSGTELDRVLDPTSGWNRTNTMIWFPLQRAIAAGASDTAYFLYYGNPTSGPPPANGDNVFLDYEDGTTLDGWTRRDSCAGTHSTSADGFVFTAGSDDCHRQLSRNIPHGDVEIFWGFRSDPGGGSDGHQTGISARRSDTGEGYVVTVADEVNTTLRIRYWTVWSTTGGAIATTPASVTPGTDYYGRFFLVGSDLRVKYWAVGSAEPAWMLEVSDATVASGAHYGQVDGYTTPQDHRHRTMILRRRVALEPILTLGEEVLGSRADALVRLAGTFQSMDVACFDAAGTAIPGCAPVTAVREIEITLIVTDASGRLPPISPITVRGRVFRQSR
ncbi:MAG: hypothetical protein ACRDF5_07995 [bacterium]